MLQHAMTRDFNVSDFVLCSTLFKANPERKNTKGIALHSASVYHVHLKSSQVTAGVQISGSE